MPDRAELMARLRAARVAAVLSGAGPCVLTLAVLGHDEHAGDPAGAAEVRALTAATPEGWECRPLRVDQPVRSSPRWSPITMRYRLGHRGTHS